MDGDGSNVGAGRTLAVQAIVLAWTAYLIKRYTDETSAQRKATERYADETVALRNETARQNKLQLRPILLPTFSVDMSQTSLKHRLLLSNVGHGCASNIRLIPLSVPDEYLKELNFPSAQVNFSEITYLASGAEAEVRFRLISQGHVLPESVFREFFFPDYPGPETSLVVSFSDIEGGYYRVKITIEAEQDEKRLPRRVIIGPIEQYSETSTIR